MNTLSIEGWCKRSDDEKSTPMGIIQFYVDEPTHLLLEKAEERLNKARDEHATAESLRSPKTEEMVDVDLATLGLVMPEGCGPLSDCQFRVYLGGEGQRGQFHLVGHLASDGSLIYSNAVMIDQLG
ncbi:MAG: hypothetical protein NDI93_05475 [Pseudomonas sp.]|nr:hypothetical protein [Pseudomonas sp.]